MKLSLDKTLSLVALSVVGALGTLPAYAQTLAETPFRVVNISEGTDVDGTPFPDIDVLKNTQRSYGMGLTFENGTPVMVGVARGKKRLRDEDVDDDLIDIEDGIAPEEQITYSVNDPIVANNFAFIAEQNSTPTPWLPDFEALGGSTPPDDTENVSRIDALYYGANSAGFKVGGVSGPQQVIDNPDNESEQTEFYVRDFEMRGIAKKGEEADISLPPLASSMTYTYDPEDGAAQTVNIGGWSVAAAVNSSNLVAGYASTEISQFGAERIDACFGDDATLPVDVCVQVNQYPSATNGIRNIQYQTRAAIWDLSDAEPQPLILPLGLTPAEDSETVFTAQGLGISGDGVVAGRSDTYRDGDTDDRRLDAGYWKKEANDAGTEEYGFNPVPFPDREYYNTIAYDVNDSGLLIGTYDRYIEGYLRTKFFTYDINAGGSIFTPLDFYGTISDLSSRPRDINDQGQVVGSIEVTHDKETSRPKAGFLYDSSVQELVDLNKVLTCESKGLEADGNGSWKPHEVKVTDGSGLELSYKTEILIVDADTVSDDGNYIVGTAFVRKPLYKVDSQGNLVDKDGEPVTSVEDAVFELNANGQPLTSFLPRAVVLEKIAGGTKEDICTYIAPDDDDAPYERKGAAGLGWLMLLPLLWVRRKIIG